MTLMYFNLQLLSYESRNGKAHNSWLDAAKSAWHSMPRNARAFFPSNTISALISLYKEKMPNVMIMNEFRIILSYLWSASRWKVDLSIFPTALMRQPVKNPLVRVGCESIAMTSGSYILKEGKHLEYVMNYLRVVESGKVDVLHSYHEESLRF